MERLLYGFYGGHVYIIHFDRNKCLQNHAIKISVFQLKKKTLLRKTPVACSQSLPDPEASSQFHDCPSGSINLFCAVKNKIKYKDQTGQLK